MQQNANFSIWNTIKLLVLSPAAQLKSKTIYTVSLAYGLAIQINENSIRMLILFEKFCIVQRKLVENEKSSLTKLDNQVQ